MVFGVANKALFVATAIRVSMDFPIALKKEFIFLRILAYDFLHFSLTRTDKLYDLVCHSKRMHGEFVFALLFERHLPFYVFDHYLICFRGFCQSTFLMSPLVLQSPTPASHHEA